MKKPRPTRSQPRASRAIRKHAPSYVSRESATPTGGDHMRRLLTALQGDPDLIRRGDVTSVAVIHQVGCPRPGGGPCCCVPDMEARGPDGRVRTIDADGVVVATARQH